MNFIVMLAALVGRRKMLFGLLIAVGFAIFLVYTMWFYSSGASGDAQRRERETLPEGKESVNKHGHICPYSAMISSGGTKYYLGPGDGVPQIGDRLQRFYCTQAQVEAAGYQPSHN